VGSLQHWVIFLSVAGSTFVLLVYSVVGQRRSQWIGLCALLIGSVCGFVVMKSVAAGAYPPLALLVMIILAIVGAVRQCR